MVRGLGGVRLLAGASLLLMALASIAPAAARREPKQGSRILNENRTYRSYIFRSYGRYRELGGYFEILRNGKRLYFREGGNFMVDQRKGSSNPLMGKDITGDGKPDLVVSEFGRGAHGPYYSYIFQIGPRFRQIATIDAEHDPASFDDLDKDGRLEVILYDWTFAYWNASFAGSPAPDVILRYRKGRYVLATDLMRKPLPSSAIIEKTAKAVADGLRKVKEYPSDDWWGDPPSELWGMMLDLIYTGHTDAAWEFLDHAWPAEVRGKQRFVSDFRKQLAKSPYWPAK